MKTVNYLLIQARKKNDPMQEHEKICFSRALKCDIMNIQCIDIIRGYVSEHHIKKADVVIIGGSGDFSIASGGKWIGKVLDCMNYLYDHSKITFASCWGFQAMAKARGGEVIHDLEQAELGTTKLWLTNEGKKDKIFQHLPHTFLAQMGHEDIVKTLPLDAILLASSEKVKNEAFTFKKKPIYCTQFHPELNKNDFIKRMTRYPEYLEKILGISKMEFINKRCKNSKDTNKLILRFLQEHVN